MNQDWTKRTTWTRRSSTPRDQSVTTGYKAGGESIELPVRQRKQISEEDQPEIVTSSTGNNSSTDDASNGSKSQQPRKIFKSFRLTTRPFGINFTITETTKFPETAVYFAVSSEFNPKQPDVVLYAGDSKNGDPLAVAYFRFSRHLRMGFGREVLTTGDGTWEQMQNMSRWGAHARYEFEYNVPDDDPQDFVWDIETDIGIDSGRTRTKFAWERTRDPKDGVTGWFEQRLGVRNYRLVQLDTGCVLAVILARVYTGCRHKADVHLHKSLSKEMEAMVIMTGTCILEKSERRIRHSSGAAASGGGV